MRKVIGSIYQETDYSVFKKLDDNRDLLAARLNKLVASISVKYVLNPIIVNENMEIVDGQGRFEALKTLKKPIPYIMVRGLNIDDCRRLNRYNSKWSSLDFVKSFAESGNQNYINLLKVSNDLDIPISHIMRMARKTISGRGENVLVNGKLEFTEDDTMNVIHVQHTADDIVTALSWKGRTNDAFRTSVVVLDNDDRYDHARMLKNCAVNRGSYQQMSSVEGQLKEFDRIYNYRVSPKNRVYFSDYMRNKGYNARGYDVQAYKATNEYFGHNVSTLE